MFDAYMVNAWLVGTVVAIVAGATGFFVVVRGRAFPAHAIPNGAFAGAAGAALVGVAPMVGMATFSVLSAVGIASLTKRARSDVATGLWLVAMLALGSAFLALSNTYESSLGQLLFGEILGVSNEALSASAVLGVICLVALALIARPLLLSSASSVLAEGRGVRERRVEMAFLLILALAATLAVPVAGSLLAFTLMVSPAATAALVASRPTRALAASVTVALVVTWSSIALSYLVGWPVGFFVGALGCAAYLVARLSVRARGSRRR
jgi:zinc/manganese transport system permease protein